MTELRFTGDPPRTTVDVTGEPIGSFALGKEVLPCPGCGKPGVVVGIRDGEPSIYGHRVPLLQTPDGWTVDIRGENVDVLFCYRRWDE